MIDFSEDIERCVEVLKNGGTILYPTDTVWGLGCDATDTLAVEKIYNLKQRPGQKAMIVLAADEREVLQLVSQVDLAVFDYLKAAGKPTTVIYEGAIGLAENLIGPDGTVAIRMVNDPFCKHLIKRIRKPLVSTSANISGEPTPSCFADISNEIKASVDYVVRYRQQDNTKAAPSAIIKWNNDGSRVIIRH